MKKLWMLFFIMILSAVPVSGKEMEKFERVESDRECKITAGKIWRNRYNFSIGRIEVVDNVIFVRTYRSLTKEEEKAIREMASPYEVSILQNYNHEESTGLQKYVFTAKDKYVQSNGMLLELDHTPYMRDGILMISWRDYINLYTDVTDYQVQSQWIGGDNQEIVFSITSKAGNPPRIYANGALSIKNNTFSTIIPNHYDGSYTIDETFDLEGQLELKEGVAYYPFSLQNLGKIRRPSIKEGWFWAEKDQWDAKTNQLTVSLHAF